MQLTLTSLVVLALAVSGRASVISLVSGGLVLPPNSYTAQTVNLAGGLQGAVIAGQPARVVLAPGTSFIGSAALVLADPAPVAVEVNHVETVQVAPAVLNVVAAQSYDAHTNH